MKKIVAVILAIFIIIFIINKKEEKTLLVSSIVKEIGTLDYKKIIIKIDDLDTNNFNYYFNNMEVLLVYPYINPIYENKISMVYVYKDIDKLKEYYINKLKSFGYYIEANKYLYTPVKINEVLIYSNLEKIKNKYNNNVITECQNSSFYCIKLE